MIAVLVLPGGKRLSLFEVRKYEYQPARQALALVWREPPPWVPGTLKEAPVQVIEPLTLPEAEYLMAAIDTALTTSMPELRLVHVPKLLNTLRSEMPDSYRAKDAGEE